MYPNLWSWRQLKIDFLSVWEVKKLLINSGRSFNFKWRYKWHRASGLKGDEGSWYIIIPFHKILSAFFILQHRAGAEKRGLVSIKSDNAWAARSKAVFILFSLACRHTQSHTHTHTDWSIQAERERDQRLSIGHALAAVPASAGSLHTHTVRCHSCNESRWRPRS